MQSKTDKFISYLKRRGGIVLVHIIVSIVAYMTNKFEGFFGLYLVTVIIYENYTFSLEEKAAHYEKLFNRTKDSE